MVYQKHEKLTRGLSGSAAGAVRLVWLIAIGLSAMAVVAVVFCLRNNRASGGNPSVAPKLSAEQLTLISSKAEKGDAEAQNRLGAAYSKGEGVKQDYHEAAKWYQLAAAQSNALAQCALGELFEAGQGVPHDDLQAANWYRQAAEQGLAAAQYDLAALYAVGKGVPLNNVEALKWYLRAANQGDPLAQYNVGMRYSEGHGVRPDVVVAYKWLSLSAAQGLPDADQALKPLKDRMSSVQLDQARELIRQFKPSGNGKL